MIALWWALCLLAIFMIGVTKSGFGSGIGLMIVPMTALAMPHVFPQRGEQAALGLLLPLLIAGDMIAVWQYRHLFSLKIVKKLLPGTVVGLLLGGLLLWWFHNRPPALAALLIRLEIGCESVILVSLHWWRTWRRGPVTEPHQPKPWQNHVTGAFAAASSTLAHAAGPIITLYLLPQGIGRDLFIGTGAIYFFIVNTCKLPVYWFGGQFKHASPLFAAGFLPLVIAGACFGWWLKNHINDKLFSKIVYCLTFGLGWYLLIDAAAKLTSRLH